MTDPRRLPAPFAQHPPTAAHQTPAPPEAGGGDRRPIEGDRHADTLTVVIPTKDRPALLKRSIQSAVAQTGVNVSVIVVDDGGEPGVAARVATAFPEVTLHRHNKNRGVSAARNTGLEMARSRWVAFLDDDDYWAPTKLARQVQAFKDSPSAGWSCVAAIHVDERGRPYYYEKPPAPERTLSALRRVGGIPGGGSGVVVSRYLAQDVGGFDERFSILADWDFYLRLGATSPLVSVDEGLVAYVRHREGMYYDPIRLADELSRLVAKYSSTPHRVTLDHAEWAVQLISMALRRRNMRTLSAVVRSDIVRKATPRALVQVGIQRFFTRLRREGHRERSEKCLQEWL